MDLNVSYSITKLSACMSNETSLLSSQYNNPTKDEAQFLDRVYSYLSTDWYDRPLWLSPIHCASFGWISIGSGILQCQSCSNKIGGHIDQNLDIIAGRLTYERLKNLLTNGHTAWCIWKSCSVPEKFLRIDIQKEVQYNFFQRFKSLNLLTKIPFISKEFYLDLNVERCRLFLNHLEDTYMENICNEQKLLSKISLALCGWSPSETNKDILICKFCKRSIGLWNYITLFEVKSNEAKKICLNKYNEDYLFDTDQIDIQNSCNLKIFMNEKLEECSITSLEEEYLDKNNKDLNYNKDADFDRDNIIGTNSKDNYSNCSSNINKDLGLATIEISPFKSAVNKLKRHLDDLNNKLQQEHKKRKTQSFKKTRLNPITEHQPWCIWVSEDIGANHGKLINIDIENSKSSNINTNKLISSNSETHITNLTDIHLNVFKAHNSLKSNFIDIKAKTHEDPPYMQLMKRIFYPVTLSCLNNEEKIEEVHRVKNLLKL